MEILQPLDGQLFVTIQEGFAGTSHIDQPLTDIGKQHTIGIVFQMGTLEWQEEANF